jgi:YebC/PmpR family DNA-binding regulatory protein
MAGHSKWANIRHRKGAQDAKRGKIFTKLIKEITVATRMGGSGDVANNPSLRAAVDKALGQNMTKDTIARAIKKGSGEAGGDNYEEARYEGYGPSGVAVMVDCLTDNKNRTVAEVRHAFTKRGGNLGTDGSVSYLFTKTGVISFSAAVDEEALMDAALEAGADDVITHEDGSIDVQTTPEEFIAVREALKEAGFDHESAEMVQVASTSVSLDANDAEKMIGLLEMLEELDDVQEVHSNADISEEILEQLA